MTARGEAGAPIVCPDGGGPAASSCDDPARLASLLPWLPARILDAGCGEGALCRRLAAADRVAAMFRARGVREVITIDPHTTTMLRTGYPKLVPGYDVRVRSYLEVLAERPAGRGPAARHGRDSRLLRLRQDRGCDPGTSRTARGGARSRRTA